jgi:hypothetical protein
VPLGMKVVQFCFLTGNTAGARSERVEQAANAQALGTSLSHLHQGSDYSVSQHCIMVGRHLPSRSYEQQRP